MSLQEQVRKLSQIREGLSSHIKIGEDNKSLYFAQDCISKAIRAIIEKEIEIDEKKHAHDFNFLEA